MGGYRARMGGCYRARIGGCYRVRMGGYRIGPEWEATGPEWEATGPERGYMARKGGYTIRILQSSQMELVEQRTDGAGKGQTKWFLLTCRIYTTDFVEPREKIVGNAHNLSGLQLGLARVGQLNRLPKGT